MAQILAVESATGNLRSNPCFGEFLGVCSTTDRGNVLKMNFSVGVSM